MPDPAPLVAAVTLSRTDVGLRAVLRPTSPTASLAFADSGSIRRDAWSASDPQTIFEGTQLRATGVRDAFELELPADAEEFDRVYPSVTRVGPASVLYGPALVAEEVPSASVVQTTGNDVVLPSEARLEEGYVFVGETGLVEPRDGYTLVGGAAVAPWIAKTVSSAAEAAFPLFASMFGPLPGAPIVTVTQDSPGPMGFHGDVTENGFVFLRFHGQVWDAFDPRAAARISTFVRHEAFHLWNRNVAPGTPPWLHEGGAEYAAVVAAVVGGVLSEADALEQVSYRAARCRAALGEQAMSELGGGGSAVYDCGVTVQWLADLGRRTSSGGEEHVFTLWASLLSQAPETGYTLASFRELAGPLAGRFLDGAGWEALGAELAGLGVEVETTPDPDEDRSRLLNHLMSSSCGSGRFGFWQEDGFVRLDTAQGCGVLSNKPELTAVESHLLGPDASQAMVAAIVRCEAGKPVRATSRDGSTLEIPCETPPSRVPGFRVLRAPALAP